MNGNGKEFTSARKFATILVTVISHPGLRQKAICQITEMNKADVSRLCRVGLDTGLISQFKNTYHEGPVIKSKTDSIINLLSKE